jgi:hypothetical protein
VFGLGKDIIGRSVSQGAVRLYVAVPPKKADQTDLCLPTVTLGVQVHLYSAMPRSLRLLVPRVKRSP